MISKDPSTQSNYLDIHAEHVAVDWTIDFEAKVISGTVIHTLRVIQGGVQEVVLDTWDLDIKDVSIGNFSVKYTLGSKHPVMGSPLGVALPADLEAGSEIKVEIAYSTTAGCTALQWLTKEQTQGKTFPYLFSQGSPIYIRSLMPIQDTPAVKITYSASVSAVLPVLLSALRVSPPADGPPHDRKTIGKDFVTYTYRQPVPIPSYLFAIASGDLRYRAFDKVDGRGWNCGVWTEPSLLEAVFWEFKEDTNKFLAAEEDTVGEYRFGTYDVLVLPPSFPYGGMENACLTFATPTLVTGDRSLVQVIVHEQAHSWFGNGVTHLHAAHFWLNEGWTTYTERLMLQILYGPAERGFEYVIGRKSLRDDLERYTDKPKYQRLVIDFDVGEDPDEAFSTIPYEKGSSMLYHLEQTVGGLDVFLPYIRDYVKTFTGKSISTDQWKEHLYEYYRVNGGQSKIDALNTIDWEAWLYGEGVELPVNLQFDVSLAKEADDLAKRWDDARSIDISQLSFKSTDLDGFNSNQKIVFLEKLQSYPALPSAHAIHLGKTYQVDSTSNAELRHRFYGLALLDPSSDVAREFAPIVARWVTGDDGTGIIKGRAKFCRPAFRAISQVDHKLAERYFLKFKYAFHPIARKLIEKDLGLV